MKTNKFFLSISIIIVTFFCSCSNDDDNILQDIEGTVTISLRNEDNGQITIGNSGVYIDKMNNFYANSAWWLSDIGEMNSLRDITEIFLTDCTNSIAVKPRNAFQIFDGNAMKEFPSGEYALSIESSYYNVYVVSEMKQENIVIGANIKYIPMGVSQNGLPDFNSNIGTLDHLNISEQEIEIELPTTDFEYKTTFDNAYNEYEHKKDGNKLKIKLVKYSSPINFGIYLRIKDS